ncbi:MAG: hypothetical protein JO340_21380 [Acidobacteriaceae bacterium]|nr:hypothetical protein [Acidobacteriaceae bacterium]
MAAEATEPIITVKLRKGLADRNRLPLQHVLSVLEEFRQMIADAGRKIQRERGYADTSGNFGLEIIAGDNGLLLKRGSVQAPIAITANVSTGLLAAQEVVNLLGFLEQEEGVLDPNVTLDAALLRRVSRVAQIQRRDKLELEVSVQRPGFPEPIKATFGAAGLASIKALQAPTFEVAGVTMYGKLVELVDRDKADEGGRGFWGELRRESGETWRVQFKATDVEKATALFRKQVVVSGNAVYYRAASPKIVVETISLDADRDYEAAFDELFGCYRDAFNSDTATLVKRMREE